MKDRVPTYPGRVKLVPVAGQENTYDMERADQPTQEGTPLNKATLLSDLTEEAIWTDSQDRTVDAALKMLADVAYGRIATINLTVKDTGGNPIPDVTVRLDVAPTLGVDPTTDENGFIRLDTNGGTHTVNLLYPIGYSAESGSQSVEVTGTRALEIKAVSRSTEKYFMFQAAKKFRIARYLSPVQIHILGGGGSGAIEGIAGYDNYMSDQRAQGGAGGYFKVVGPIDVAGKLIQVTPGSGGRAQSANGGTCSYSGNSGGTTTVTIDGTKYSAAGGRGGYVSSSKNTAGGAAGGAGTGYPNYNGGDGAHLFNDASLPNVGSGGGGALAYSVEEEDEEGSLNAYVEWSCGSSGKGGGTDGAARKSSDAVTGGGSGGVAGDEFSNSKYNAGSGKGGDGLAAFRKAV